MARVKHFVSRLYAHALFVMVRGRLKIMIIFGPIPKCLKFSRNSQNLKNMFQPIFIPFNFNTQQDRPKYEICKCCGQEIIPESETSWKDGLLAFLFVALAFWICLTVLIWLLDLGADARPTSLIHHFTAQFMFLWDARKYIF